MLPNRVGCTSTFDSLRRYLKHPAKNKRNRQTEDDEQNNQSNDPVRNVEDRKNLRDALREGPTRDDVSNADFVNVAPLQLGKEVVDLHWMRLGHERVEKQKTRCLARTSRQRRSQSRNRSRIPRRDIAVREHRTFLFRVRTTFLQHEDIEDVRKYAAEQG